jgi:DNA gyrase subunit A
VSDAKLFSLVPAPDFPTGATIMGTDGARKLYSTGNGGIVLRAVTHIEQIKGGKGAMTRTAIIVTELPYQVNKSSLLEKIAEMVNDKKIDGIADLRDESDRDGIRVVIELKRDAVPAVVQVRNLYCTSLPISSFYFSSEHLTHGLCMFIYHRIICSKKLRCRRAFLVTFSH